MRMLLHKWREWSKGSPVPAVQKTRTQTLNPLCLVKDFPCPSKVSGQLEFVDTAELLRDNIEAERRSGVQGEGSNTSKKPRRETPDILSWLQCFGIYVSVTASKFPE